MAPVIVTTLGARNANSYESQQEAADYFDNRIPLPTPWVASGEASARALISATRVLDMMAVPHKTLRRGADCGCDTFYTSKAWTGSPASTTQRLAWPRIGMLDRNGNALDVAISAISAAAQTQVTTSTPHRRQAGDVIFVSASDSTPTLNGERTVLAVIDDDNFTVDLVVTVAGVAGKVTWMPDELKDAEAELAGQLLMQDTTLDNAVIVGGITSVRAGSVAVTFKDMIEQHVLPDAVINLMPPSWLSDEVVTPADPAEFDVIA